MQNCLTVNVGETTASSTAGVQDSPWLSSESGMPLESPNDITPLTSMPHMSVQFRCITKLIASASRDAQFDGHLADIAGDTGNFQQRHGFGDLELACIFG